MEWNVENTEQLCPSTLQCLISSVCLVKIELDQPYNYDGNLVAWKLAAGKS